jgi:hypothetical protein
MCADYFPLVLCGELKIKFFKGEPYISPTHVHTVISDIYPDLPWLGQRLQYRFVFRPFAKQNTPTLLACPFLAPLIRRRWTRLDEVQFLINHAPVKTKLTLAFRLCQGQHVSGDSIQHWARRALFISPVCKPVYKQRIINLFLNGRAESTGL